MIKYFCLIALLCFFLTLKYVYAGDELEIKILQPAVVNRTLSIGELVREISNRRIIYIGEMHDNKVHHQLQEKIISDLFGINSKIAIGMEMFRKESQDELNSYLNGAMNEDEFLESTDYKNGWGFDFTLYKPILEFAKEHKLPVIALNISPDVIGKVSDSGIAALDAVTLNMLPGSIDFSIVNYRDILMDIYKEHPHTESSNFDRFYEVQLIWDEFMADSIDNFLVNNPDTQLVVITGNGHLVYDYGIPSRVYRRNKKDYVTIVQDIEENQGVADFIVITPES